MRTVMEKGSLREEEIGKLKEYKEDLERESRGFEEVISKLKKGQLNLTHLLYHLVDDAV